MTAPPRPERRLPRPLGLLWAGLLIGLLSPLASRAEDATEILVIVESDSRLPLVRQVLKGMETALGTDVPGDVELYIEFLDMLRFNDPDALDHMGDFLATRFGGEDLDAVAVLGPNALGFVVDRRDEIAPGAPIVFGAISEVGLRQVMGDALPPGVTGVLSPFDIAATLELAREVQPDATQILVVAGSAPFDRQWRASAEALLGTQYLGLPVVFAPEQDADAILDGVRSVDPSSIVLYLSVNLDAEGRRFLPVDFGRLLAEASAAPVWVVYETMIGAGLVGGSVEDLDQTGRMLGDLVTRAAAGDTSVPPITVSTRPTVDWRAMQRYGLDESRLPDATRVLFYDPPVWVRYRDEIAVIAAIILAQAITIAALIVQSWRYQKAQSKLATETAQLVHVSRITRLGQLSAGLAHEINQPLAAILANAEAGSRFLRRDPPDLGEVSEIFDDIATDVRRAGSIIADLRRLMVKGETEVEPLDLNEIVRATLALAVNEVQAKGARVETMLAADRLEVAGNRGQLQQIVLNLVLNAAEAGADLPPSDRVVTVVTRRPGENGVELLVADRGPGVPADQREAVFRPFYSTKPSGLGVGLAICRDIAAAHGGTLAFVDPVRAGAHVVLTLPAVGQAAA